MGSDEAAGGCKLVLVPADQVRKAEPGQAGTPAHGDWAWLASCEDWDVGPFEVVADIGPDRKIRMSRLLYEQIEVIG